MYVCISKYGVFFTRSFSLEIVGEKICFTVLEMSRNEIFSFIRRKSADGPPHNTLHYT